MPLTKMVEIIILYSFVLYTFCATRTHFSPKRKIVAIFSDFRYAQYTQYYQSDHHKKSQCKKLILLKQHKFFESIGN